MHSISDVDEQILYTVEYEDYCGVVYYRNVKAADFSEAKMIVRQSHPDAVIRAVTQVADMGATTE